ncbi:MAG: hypothetical protein HYW25_04360, partial [Candidatus Aenigmarchaeota archaeon]|nr:hypothetical protein [Candidatus Aenigmarchaeota archaeon]
MGFEGLATTDSGKKFLGRADKTTGTERFWNSGIDPGKGFQYPVAEGKSAGRGFYEFA